MKLVHVVLRVEEYQQLRNLLVWTEAHAPHPEKVAELARKVDTQRFEMDVPEDLVVR